MSSDDGFFHCAKGGNCKTAFLQHVGGEAHILFYGGDNRSSSCLAVPGEASCRPGFDPDAWRCVSCGSSSGEKWVSIRCVDGKKGENNVIKHQQEPCVLWEPALGTVRRRHG